MGDAPISQSMKFYTGPVNRTGRQIHAVELLGQDIGTAAAEFAVTSLRSVAPEGGILVVVARSIEPGVSAYIDREHPGVQLWLGWGPQHLPANRAASAFLIKGGARGR